MPDRHQLAIKLGSSLEAGIPLGIKPEALRPARTAEEPGDPGLTVSSATSFELVLDFQLVRDVTRDMEPALVGVVGNGAAIGENELSTGCLCQSILGLTSNLAFWPLRKRTKLVPSAHQALTGHGASLSQAWPGDPIRPTQHLDGVVQNLIEHQISVAVDVKNIEPAMCRSAKRDQIVRPAELPVGLDWHDGRRATLECEKDAISTGFDHVVNVIAQVLRDDRECLVHDRW